MHEMSEIYLKALNNLLLLKGIVKTVLLNGLITPLFSPFVNALQTICLFRSLSFSSMSELTTENDVFFKKTRVPK